MLYICKDQEMTSDRVRAQWEELIGIGTVGQCCGNDKAIVC